MNDTNNTLPTPVIEDVKHYVITMDADGNEVRTEVTEAEVRKDFEQPAN